MTDRYTELVKQAYEAQQAREGPSYQVLTTELTGIDADLEALSAKREATCAALEAMDEAVEAAKEALDAYFAGRDEEADSIEGTVNLDHELFVDPSISPPDRAFYSGDQWPAEVVALASEEDEYASAKANGALS